MDTVVMTTLSVLGVYTLVGLVFLVPFHRWAVPHLDASANGASIGFRAVISPGLVALWPVVLRKWMAARHGRTVHGRTDAPVSSLAIRRLQSMLIKLLAIALPLLLVPAIASRPASPAPSDATPAIGGFAGD